MLNFFTRKSGQLRNIRLKSTLVLVEQKDGKIASSTLNAITAAMKLSPDNKLTAIATLSSAKDLEALGKQLQQVPKVDSILLSQSESPSKGDQLAENVAVVLAEQLKNGKFDYLLTAHSVYGKNILPRVAALLAASDVVSATISDVVSIVDGQTFKRPIYAGNAIATVKSLEKLTLLSVRSTSFPPAELLSSPSTVEHKKVAPPAAHSAIKFVGEELAKSDRPELGSAKTVVAGGRGLKNGENFELLYKLADKLGGAVGASRAAVDAGYVPNDLQIGQTGKIVAPQLYVAVGISGAIQHLAGMKDSKVIVAINKDAEAPIFQVADFGLVEDLFKAVPELTEKL